MAWKRSMVAAVALVALAAGATVSYAVSRDGDEAPPEPSTLGPAEWPARAEVAGEYPRPDLISEPQWAMVQDGWVTDEEMRAAVEATAECIRAQGFDARVVPGDPRDRVARNILVVMQTEESPSAVVFACKEEFMSDLDLMYSSQERARSPITIAQGTLLFDECLTASGYPPPPGRAVNPYSAERLGPLDETAAGGQAIMRCNRVVEDAHRGGPITAP